MPETYYRTGRYEVDHATFGGVIYDMDFNTLYPISRDIAGRIAAAQSFDNWCKYYKGNNYSLPKERNKKYD